MIRREAQNGATIIFSTHVIAHAERLCERIAIIAAGKVAFDGSVAEARDRCARSSASAPAHPTARGATAIPARAAKATNRCSSCPKAGPSRC